MLRIVIRNLVGADSTRVHAIASKMRFKAIIRIKNPTYFGGKRISRNVMFGRQIKHFICELGTNTNNLKILKKSMRK